MQMQRQQLPQVTHHEHRQPQMTLLESVILASLSGVRLELSDGTNRNDARRRMVAANIERTAALRVSTARRRMMKENAERSRALREKFESSYRRNYEGDLVCSCGILLRNCWFARGR